MQLARVVVTGGILRSMLTTLWFNTPTESVITLSHAISSYFKPIQKKTNTSVTPALTYSKVQLIIFVPFFFFFCLDDEKERIKTKRALHSGVALPV